MLQKIKKYLFIVFGFFLLLGLIPISSVKATSSVAGCTSNVDNQNSWLDIRTKKVQQLVDIREDHLKLTGVAVRLWASGGQDAQVTVQVKKRDGVTRIASVQGGTTITQTPAWYYFDLTDVDLPRATYFLEVGSFTGFPQWNYAMNNTCYDGGYVVIDGVHQTDKSMGFGIYAYDSTSSVPASNDQPADNGDPSSNPTYTPNDTSSTNNEDLPSSDNTADSSSDNSSDVSTPDSNADTSSIPSVFNVGKKSSGSGNFWEYLIPVVLIAIILLGPIIFIIWMVKINRKKKNSEKFAEKNDESKDESKKDVKKNEESTK